MTVLNFVQHRRFQEKCSLESLNKLHQDYTFAISSSGMFTHPEDILSQQSHVWHGVALGWRKELSSNIQLLDSHSDRIVGARLKCQSKSLLFSSCYAPTSGQDDDFMEFISSLTTFLAANKHPDDHIVFGADTNCSAKSSKRRQEVFQSFCESNSLDAYRPSQPTFHHHNGTSNSSIDAIISSNNTRVAELEHFCTVDDPFNLSCHDPISVHIEIPVHIVQHPTQGFYNQTYSSLQSRLRDGGVQTC